MGCTTYSLQNRYFIVDPENKLTSVVLIGVDTPETVHPEKPIESYGKEATTFIKNLLIGESIYLRFDGNRTDKYGGMIAYFYRAPDGLFVNFEIVRQGYGKVYTVFPFKHRSLFQHYSGQAQQAHRGLWRLGNTGASSNITKEARAHRLSTSHEQGRSITVVAAGICGIVRYR